MAARSFKLLRSFALTSLFTLIPACAAHSTSSGLSYPQGRPSLAPDTFNASIKESEPGQLPLFALQPERSAGAIDNNTNPLALAQLFRRQACSFNHNGSPRTCNDPSNKCCYDPNNSREGWCCDMTDFCGHNTGTDQRCTYRITYTTSTYWVTEYTTKTSTFISSIAGTTEWTTVAITIYVTASTDAGIATVWDEITVLAPRVGRKGREVEMTKAHTPLPSPANAVPSITADTKYLLKPRKVHQPQVTEPPRFIKIRGLLYPRQSMRTDTSEYVVTSTSWVTRVSEITSLITYDQTSTRYDTTTSTHTAAVDAHTTVTHSSTVTLQPGETAPSSDKISSGGGDRKSRRGLSIGARIGIGIGVALGLVLIVAIIGFFINKKKVQQPGAPGDGKHPAFFFRNPPSAARFYTPISPPPSDLMYSQASDSPRYTTPSPGTQYTYLPVLAPVFKERPAMGTAQMGPPPISYTLMQQHYQVFQNPKPPSPVVGRQTPSPAPTAPASAPPEYQAKETSETPILHSPHPYRG